VAASLVGQKLGKYEITQLIGHGGMATVYKGHQGDIDRNVAIKVLPPHPGQDDQFVERFRLEARTIARLQHPHILPLYDYGDDDGVLYLVMAYIEGGSIHDRVRRGAMPSLEVDRMIKQIAGALDYAHRQGVIHRDLKPDNVLLDREGHALLADFGIVKLIEGSPSGSSLTVTGGLVGTPAYMSPEQAQGLVLDNRSDLYSLGVVVFEMLTGKQPYLADTPMQVVFKHVSAPIPPARDLNPALPAGVDDVMRRILAKNAEERYSTATAFAEDLSRALRGEPTNTPSTGTYIFPPGMVQANPPTQSATNTPPPETGVYPPYPPGTGQYPPGTYPPGTMYPPNTTIITQPGTNPLVLLGGFAIIAILLVVVVLIVVNQNRPPDVLIAPPGTLQGGGFQMEAPVVIMPTPSEPIYGQANFSTTNSLGDTLNLRLENVRVPSTGEIYAAWLTNTASGELLSLGEVNIDGLGNGALTYQTDQEIALPTRYNALLITREQGVSDAPSENVAYSGHVPVEVAQALSEILVAMLPTGDATQEPSLDMDDSLINGALAEAGIAARHAGLAAGANSVGSMRQHAEHTINILNGTQVDYDGNGRGENPGRGFGVLTLLNAIWERLNVAINAPETNHLVQSQAELIRICTVNANQWKDQVVALETEILAASDIEVAHDDLVESTVLAQALVSGTDLNDNGQVEPFEGECGLQQILDYGVYVGNMEIFAGSFEG